MNVRHPMAVIYSFSIKNIFYDKMDFFILVKCKEIKQKRKD